MHHLDEKLDWFDRGELEKRNKMEEEKIRLTKLENIKDLDALVKGDVIIINYNNQKLPCYYLSDGHLKEFCFLTEIQESESERKLLFLPIKYQHIQKIENGAIVPNSIDNEIIPGQIEIRNNGNLKYIYEKYNTIKPQLDRLKL